MMRNEVDWSGGMDYEILCTVDGTIAHCVLATFVPFHPVRPQILLLMLQLRYISLQKILG